MKSEKEFNTQLIQGIDEALRQIFTETAMATIYKYLDKQYSLKREDIPEKLEVFTQGLEEFFRSGAVVVESVILKNLCLNLELEVRQIKHNQDFVDWVQRLKSYVLHDTKPVQFM